MNITADEIKSVVSKLQENKCNPLTIRTDREAKQFTDNDILDRTWHKGDKYYTAYIDGSWQLIEFHSLRTHLFGVG